MIKLNCCHNLLQLQGTICFDSASQKVQPTVPTFFFFFLLSFTDQSNTEIMRTGNNNDSITIINNNNSNNNNDIYDNNTSNWPFLDVVRMDNVNERISFT